MKKRLFIGMIAVAGLLLTTSCLNEVIEVQKGDEAQVTFTLGIENEMGTRAISDGTSVDKLVYALFDGTGNRVDGFAKVEKTVTFPVTETIALVKGKTYQLVFWAQDSDCSAYTVSDDMKVTVDYTGVNNDETRDAFFKSETFTVTGDATINVVLKRPFAQLNLGVYNDDYESAVALGNKVINSKAVIKKAATGINLLDGTVTGEAEVTYDFSAIPAEKLLVDLNNDGVKEEYTYLSMSYILPNDATTGSAKTTLESLSFTLQAEDNSELVVSEGLTNVPVQRNWRTNIIGKIFSSNVTFNISIDPIYEGDYNGVLITGQDAFMAAIADINAAGEDATITLAADVSWATGNAGGGANTMFSNAGTTITVEGNGHKLTATGAGGIKNAANVVFNNVVFIDETAYLAENGEVAWEFCYLEYEVGNYTFNNCTFNNSVMFAGASTTVNNCTFKGISTNLPNQSNEYCAWVYNGTASFTNCYFSNGYRGLKICDFYTGSDVTNATVDNCTFENLSKKPGVAIDNRQGEMSVTISNSTFTNVQPGDQGLYIYETDNVVPTLVNNTVN
jgi:hypothetical protein